MTPPGGDPGGSPARHELPTIDAAALTAARWADRVVRAAEERGVERWRGYLAPIPDALRDAGLRELRAVALRARAAYGPKDSVRDALPEEVVEPFRDALDLLLKEIARYEARR